MRTTARLLKVIMAIMPQANVIQYTVDDSKVRIFARFSYEITKFAKKHKFILTIDDGGRIEMKRGLIEITLFSTIF